MRKQHEQFLHVANQLRDGLEAGLKSVKDDPPDYFSSVFKMDTEEIQKVDIWLKRNGGLKMKIVQVIPYTDSEICAIYGRPDGVIYRCPIDFIGLTDTGEIKSLYLTEFGWKVVDENDDGFICFHRWRCEELTPSTYTSDLGGYARDKAVDYLARLRKEKEV